MSDLTEVDQLLLSTQVTPYEDADDADVVLSCLGAVIGCNYTSSGEVVLKISFPQEIFSPEEIMKSLGEMVYWQGRKV